MKVLQSVPKVDPSHSTTLKVGLSVNECETQSKGLADLKEKYPEVFTGLGKLKDYQLKLHLDKSVTPVAQAVRRIPYSRRQKVVDKLDELERLDVIEKVSGPTTWVNPLVTVDKPNGDVRICLDMRRANQAITRERHPIPTMEETLQNVGGAKVFAKLDMNMAFHQIELDVDSRDITTFAGPNGLYRYKRLLFGVNMATEKFQHIMWQIVQGLPGVHSMHDDIRVVADNHNQLYERVEAVVKALSAKNLTLNFDKCIMGVDKIQDDIHGRNYHIYWVASVRRQGESHHTRAKAYHEVRVEELFRLGPVLRQVRGRVGDDHEFTLGVDLGKCRMELDLQGGGRFQ